MVRNRNGIFPNITTILSDPLTLTPTPTKSNQDPFVSFPTPTKIEKGCLFHIYSQKTEQDLFSFVHYSY
jgi:hypothetical protein